MIAAETEMPSRAGAFDAPGSLAHMLDVERVKALASESSLVTAHPGTVVNKCEALRINVPNTRGVVADYALRLAGSHGERTVMAFGIMAGARMSERVHPGEGRDGGHALVLRPMGIDEKLPSLSFLLNGSGSGAGVTGPGWLKRADTRGTLLAHRLWRRAVLRLEPERPRATGGSAIAKVFKPGSASVAFNVRVSAQLRSQTFGRGASISVPRTLGCRGDHGLWIMEDVPGSAVCDVDPMRVEGAYALAGMALARLHGTPVEGLALFGPDREVELLARRCDIVERFYPAHAQTLRVAVDRIITRFDRCRSFDQATVHRDFHEKQVLVDGDRATLIDFDTLCLGDPAQDIGNFLAHLDLRCHQGLGNQSQQEDAFLAGYASVRQLPDGERCQVHRASTLLRLASIQVLTSRWDHLFAPLIEEARLQ